MLGEWSPSVMKLLDDLAKIGAPIHLRAAMTHSLQVARFQLKQLMVQRLGICVLNSHAHMVHELLNKYEKLKFKYPTGPYFLPPDVARAARREPGGDLCHSMERQGKVTQMMGYSGAPSSAGMPYGGL